MEGMWCIFVGIDKSGSGKEQSALTSEGPAKRAGDRKAGFAGNWPQPKVARRFRRRIRNRSPEVWGEDMEATPFPL